MTPIPRTWEPEPDSSPVVSPTRTPLQQANTTGESQHDRRSDESQDGASQTGESDLSSVSEDLLETTPHKKVKKQMMGYDGDHPPEHLEFLESHTEIVQERLEQEKQNAEDCTNLLDSIIEIMVRHVCHDSRGLN